MTTAFSVLGVLHWIGLGVIVLGYGLSLGRGVIHELMVWGARVQLLLGLALVAVADMSGARLDHAWVAVKLLVAVAVVGLCEVSRSRAERGAAQPVLTHLAAALAAVNVAVATLWR